MPIVLIPQPIIEETGCLNADDNYTYFAVTRPLAAGEEYHPRASLNGAMLTAAPAAGFASLGEFKTWANANWAPASITISGNKVTLATATGTKGSLAIDITQ